MNDHESLVTVYSLDSAETAEIIRNALEEEGITCRIGNEHQAGLTGVMRIDILVLERDAERAQEIIRTRLE